MNVRASAEVGESGRAVNPLPSAEQVRFLPRPLTYVPTQLRVGDRRRALLEMALEERDGPDCFYCGRDRSNGRDLWIRHIDHVVPKRLGGSDGIDNLVFACDRCNLTKGLLPGWFHAFRTSVVRLADRPRNFLLDFGKTRLSDWALGTEGLPEPPSRDSLGAMRYINLNPESAQAETTKKETK